MKGRDGDGQPHHRHGIELHRGPFVPSLDCYKAGGSFSLHLQNDHDLPISKDSHLDEVDAPFMNWYRRQPAKPSVSSDSSNTGGPLHSARTRSLPPLSRNSPASSLSLPPLPHECISNPSPVATEVVVMGASLAALLAGSKWRHSPPSSLYGHPSCVDLSLPGAHGEYQGAHSLRGSGSSTPRSSSPTCSTSMSRNRSDSDSRTSTRVGCKRPFPFAEEETKPESLPQLQALGFQSLSYSVAYDRHDDESIALRKVEHFLQRTLDLTKGGFSVPRPRRGVQHPYNTQLSALRKNRPNLPDPWDMPKSVHMVLGAAFPGWNHGNEPVLPQKGGGNKLPNQPARVFIKTQPPDYPSYNEQPYGSVGREGPITAPTNYDRLGRPQQFPPPSRSMPGYGPTRPAPQQSPFTSGSGLSPAIAPMAPSMPHPPSEPSNCGPPVFPVCICLVEKPFGRPPEMEMDIMKCEVSEGGEGGKGLQVVGPQGVMTGKPLKIARVALSLLYTITPLLAQQGWDVRPDLFDPTKRITLRMSLSPLVSDFASLGLPIFLSLLSAFSSARLVPNTSVFGQVSLTGEVHSVADPLSRVELVGKSSSQTLILPWENRIQVATSASGERNTTQLQYVTDVFQVLRECLDSSGSRSSSTGAILRPMIVREDALERYGTGHAILMNNSTLFPFDVECCAHVGSGQVHLSGPGVNDKEEGRDTISSMTSAMAANTDSVVSAAWAAMHWVVMEQEWIRDLFGGELKYDFRYMVKESLRGQQNGNDRMGRSPIDVHIHFPRGVDTAWYGAALALALVSLLTGEKTLAAKVGITASMTRQGSISSTKYVSSVGRAAVESGVHMLLWVTTDPRESFPPPGQMVPPKLQVVHVAHMREAVKAAFGRL